MAIVHAQHLGISPRLPTISSVSSSFSMSRQVKLLRLYKFGSRVSIGGLSFTKNGQQNASVYLEGRGRALSGTPIPMAILDSANQASSPEEGEVQVDVKEQGAMLVVSKQKPTKRKLGRIGSRRGKGVSQPDNLEFVPAKHRSPFLEAYRRKYHENGFRVLHDEDLLLERASNPYVLALEVGEKANAYLREDKDGSLIRKPILRVISDKINEIVGEKIRDSYIVEKPDYENL